jgi:hypothetical protein
MEFSFFSFYLDNSVTRNPEQVNTSLLTQELSGDGASVIDSIRYGQEAMTSVLSVKMFLTVMPYPLQRSFYRLRRR